MKTSHLILFLLTTPLAVQAAPEKGLFDNPVELFSEAFLPALSHSEQARIQTTWRGFYLRVDTQSGLQEEYSPSGMGVYLDVAVRDPEEIPVFKDAVTAGGALTRRTVEIPAPATDQVALRITLVYGKDASAETLAAIRKSIARTIRISGHETPAEPPPVK